MEIILIKVDPAKVKSSELEAIVTSLIKAKHGTIIVARENITFEVLKIESEVGSDVGDQTLVAITKDGKRMKLLHDPRENLPKKAEYKH